MNEVRLERLCRRVNDQYQNAIANNLPLVDAFVNASRLWNLIDYLDEPEPHWATLRTVCPWAFRDPTKTNSIRFFYRHRQPLIIGGEV